ncbi:hypothetical protein C8R45DRAFT_932007 [Mycena sanguinolenta]|nr:hypothetical protein C8R45DRAFT_932007 [Mycena sanguinolenta]
MFLSSHNSLSADSCAECSVITRDVRSVGRARARRAPYTDMILPYGSSPGENANLMAALTVAAAWRWVRNFARAVMHKPQLRSRTPGHAPSSRYRHRRDHCPLDQVRWRKKQVKTVGRLVSQRWGLRSYFEVSLPPSLWYSLYIEQKGLVECSISFQFISKFAAEFALGIQIIEVKRGSVERSTVELIHATTYCWVMKSVKDKIRVLPTVSLVPPSFGNFHPRSHAQCGYDFRFHPTAALVPPSDMHSAFTRTCLGIFRLCPLPFSPLYLSWTQFGRELFTNAPNLLVERAGPFILVTYGNGRDALPEPLPTLFELSEEAKTFNFCLDFKINNAKSFSISTQTSSLRVTELSDAMNQAYVPPNVVIDVVRTGHKPCNKVDS